jgi:polyisoprenoid-binding protein YceI
VEHYSIALQKSQFQFKAYSLLAKPIGTFHSFTGDIVADAQQVGASSVRFVIDAASIDTANAKRDKHLRSKDFLFVEKYPTISFRSTAITQEGAGYLVQGNLELRGITKLLTIPVKVEQHQDDIVVQGRITLNRRDFGVQYNFMLNPVQDEIDVLFTIVGVKHEPVSAAR